MERQFALPVTFAAVAHAALFFGIPEKPRAVADTRIICPSPRTFVLPDIELDPPIAVEHEAESKQPQPTIDAPQPQQPEPPVIDTSVGPTMPVPEFRPSIPGDVARFELPARPGSHEENGLGFGPILPQHLDNPPHTRFQAAPVYPFAGKREGWRGEVMVEFVVDESGHVREPRIVSSSHRIFDEPTLRAVAKWRFDPGRRDGRVVRFKMAVPVIFNLHE